MNFEQWLEEARDCAYAVGITHEDFDSISQDTAQEEYDHSTSPEDFASKFYERSDELFEEWIEKAEAKFKGEFSINYDVRGNEPIAGESFRDMFNKHMSVDDFVIDRMRFIIETHLNIANRLEKRLADKIKTEVLEPSKEERAAEKQKNIEHMLGALRKELEKPGSYIEFGKTIPWDYDEGQSQGVSVTRLFVYNAVPKKRLPTDERTKHNELSWEDWQQEVEKVAVNEGAFLDDLCDMCNDTARGSWMAGESPLEFFLQNVQISEPE